MPDLDHLLVTGFTTGRAFKSSLSTRSAEPPQRDREAHGHRLLQQLARLRLNADAIAQERAALGIAASTGMTIAIEFHADSDFDVKQLEWKRDQIEVLTVADSGNAKVVALHVPEGKLSALETRLYSYLHDPLTPYQKPKHANLINAIETIRSAAFNELWTEDFAPPEPAQEQWLQIWLRLAGQVPSAVSASFHEVAQQFGIQIEPGYLSFPGRVVVIAHTSRAILEKALRLLDAVAEIRAVQPHAEFFLSELAPRDQVQWVHDLVQRCSFTPKEEGPYVTLLDTGVNRAHPLLEEIVAQEDVLAVHPEWGGADMDGHGTEMAGVICHGDLTAPLAHTSNVAVPHRLESVKIFPPQGVNPPHLYGWVVAKAVNTVEQRNPDRQRIFVTMATAIGPGAGKPTEWSGCIDQLAFGLDAVAPYSTGVHWGAEGVLNKRLFVLAAGNVPWQAWNDYPDINHNTSIEDPGQSWNAITVGACTHLDEIDRQRWPSASAIGQTGGLCPASTTSRLWRHSWPLKPDVVAEGGNGSLDHTQVVSVGPNSLRVLTTSHRPHHSALAETGDTSAAAAEVARICAHLRSRYPSYREETIRALVIHGARFTPQMRAGLPAAYNKADIKDLLRTFGFGKASLENSLVSDLRAPTLVVQDTIVPFRAEASNVYLNQMKLHELPWPAAELEALGAAHVEMRVTLSYFVEPNPSRRGWQSKFRYQSHGLRFAVKGSTEDEERFTQRINKADREEAEDLDENEQMNDPDRHQWDIGAQLRARGSVHSDVWKGTAAQLRDKSHIAIFPVGGWWKDWPGAARAGVPVQYSLVVSLSILEGIDIDVDLYTPIATQIATKIAAGTVTY